MCVCLKESSEMRVKVCLLSLLEYQGLDPVKMTNLRKCDTKKCVGVACNFKMLGSVNTTLCLHARMRSIRHQVLAIFSVFARKMWLELQKIVSIQSIFK